MPTHDVDPRARSPERVRFPDRGRSRGEVEEAEAREELGGVGEFAGLEMRLGDFELRPFGPLTTIIGSYFTGMSSLRPD